MIKKDVQEVVARSELCGGSQNWIPLSWIAKGVANILKGCWW